MTPAGACCHCLALGSCVLLGPAGVQDDCTVPAQAMPLPAIGEHMLQAQREGVEIVICDTSGRLHTNVSLMDELAKCKRAITKRMASAPHEVLLVLDGTTGGAAAGCCKLAATTAMACSCGLAGASCHPARGICSLQGCWWRRWDSQVVHRASSATPPSGLQPLLCNSTEYTLAKSAAGADQHHRGASLATAWRMCNLVAGCWLRAVDKGGAPSLHRHLRGAC